jgi:hypothetical protein
MAGEDLPRADPRVLRFDITATAFSRRLRRLSEDVTSAFLCEMRRALRPDPNRKVNEADRKRVLAELTRDLDGLARGLRDYLSEDIASATREAFHSLERPLGAKLRAPITLADDPARMAIARTFQSIGEDLERTFYRAEIERAQAAIADAVAGRVVLALRVQGAVLRPIAKGVDAAERELLADLPVPTRMLEFQGLLDAARDDLVWWVRLLRTCMAVALLDGLPYRQVWGDRYDTSCARVATDDDGIFGDAGYLLATEVVRMAIDLELSPAYQELVALASADTWLDDLASFSPDLAAPSQYPLVRTRTALAFDPRLWQEHCTIGGCRYKEQGDAFPFEFPAMNNDVINYPSLVGLDQMHARTSAQRRIVFIRTLWDLYHDDDGKRAEVVLAPEDEKAIQKKTASQQEAERAKRTDLEFRVTAGSLEHGGAHPPHRTHRNGANFDVVVNGVLPLHCKGRGEMSEEDAVREAQQTPDGGAGGATVPAVSKENVRLVPPPRPQPSAAPSLFIEGPFLHADDPGQTIRSTCRQWDYPARTITRDGVNIAIEKVGMRITQCILLSFPSQIILQDWRTLRDATNDLITRFEELEASSDENADRSAIKHILQWLGKREPEDEPAPPWRGRLALVPGHHDHWHISYDPAEVEEPPGGREDTLQWIEAHLAEILPD